MLCAEASAQQQRAGLAPTVNTVMYPPPQYFAALQLYYAGDYADAGVAFAALNTPAGAIPKLPAASICFLTMQGECFYQTGQYALALANYEAAIKIHFADRTWVRLGQSVLPPGARPSPPPPWYVSKRGTAAWNYPPVATSTGAAAPFMPNRLPNAGPTGAAAYSVNCQEIARCAGLAMYRWLELLGPLARHDPFMLQLVDRRSYSAPARSVLPWMIMAGIEKGFYTAANQKPAPAEAALQSALTFNGLDHPLTGLALLALGQLAAGRGDYAKAETYFLEASAAASQFGDLTVVEEALRAAATIHLASGDRKPYAPLHSALGWASASGGRQLLANLQLLAAEDNYQAGLAAPGAADLAACHQIVAASGMGLSRIGARLSFLDAAVAYAAGDLADGQAALQLALAFQRQRSLWKFRTESLGTFWRNGLISEREAVACFARALSDPTPSDWALDPLEGFSSLIIPHPESFEHWFDAALARKEPKLALEVVEQLRRHRFLCTLEGGGRLLGLRWALEGRDELLDKESLQQRQAILGRWPEYARLSLRAKQIQSELKSRPLLPKEREEQKLQHERLTELKRISIEQEVLLHQMAVSRQGCKIAFPPLRTTEQIQAALANRQGVLVFFESSRRLHAFLITSTECDHWQISAPPKQVAGRVKSLLQAWGNLDANKPIPRQTLDSDRWKPAARELFRNLMGDCKLDFSSQLDELAIVPDGMLWYLPFEALQVPEGNGSRALIAAQRIRYVPTAGLAAGDAHPHRPRTAAILPGKLFPREDERVAQDWQQEMLGVLPHAALLEGKLPAESREFGSLLDELIIYRESSAGRSGPLGWTPLPTTPNGKGPPLADWLSLPWGAPDQLMLPGFHTLAESAARGLSEETAMNEIFLPLCGLMASGSRTVLINRWRTGGETGQDLLREFVQELPGCYASDAWQRSVQLAMSHPLRFTDEPRLERGREHEALLADHPFFWAGFLLADTGSPPPALVDDKLKK